MWQKDEIRRIDVKSSDLQALEVEGAVMIPRADPEFGGNNCIDNERKTMCKTGPLKPEHQSGPSVSAIVLKLKGPPQLLIRSITIYTPLPHFHQYKPIRRDLEVTNSDLVCTSTLSA